MKTFFTFVAVLLLISLIDAAPKPNKKPDPNPKARTQRNASPKSTLNPNSKVSPRHAPTLNPTNSKAGAKHAQTLNPHSKVNARHAPNPKSNNAKTKRQLLVPAVPYYPYAQPQSSLIDFQHSLQAAFIAGFQAAHSIDLATLLKLQNATDANGKLMPLDAKTLQTFETVFGDSKNGSSQIVALDNLGSINYVNPFILTKEYNGKLMKADMGLPTFKAGKNGNSNGTALFALVNPYQDGPFVPAFGPEIAPQYEIYPTPNDLSLPTLPPYGSASVYPYDIGLAPGYGPAPSPYPFPYYPGYNPNGAQPNGNGNGKKPDSAAAPTETSSESNPEATSQSSPDSMDSGYTSESSAGSSSSESPSSESPQ